MTFLNAVPARMRTPATVVWVVLVLATVVSWALGSDHGVEGDWRRVASVAVLIVAFVKVRFIGMYFMDLRDAPLPLRAGYQLYCLAVCATVVGFYLAA